MLQDMPDIKYGAGGITVGKRLDANSGLTATGTVSLPAGTTIGGQTVTSATTILPADHGLSAWTFDPALAAATQVAASGTLYLSAVALRRTTSLSKVWWIQSAAGVTATTGQNFGCLISPSGTVLSSGSADANVTAPNGAQSVTLSVAQSNLAAGWYWVGLLFNAATGPTLGRSAGLLQSTNNLNLSGASLRFATNGAGLTALPASITPGSNTTGPSVWAAVS